MKYKVYLKGNQCIPFFKGNRCIWDMYTKPPGSNPTIEDGGDINLPNGDVLHIGPKMGPCYNDEYEGIGLSLESGNEFFVYFFMPEYEREQETGYGAIYDYPEEEMYAQGNFFRIYPLDGESIYDHEDAFYGEHSLAGIDHYTIYINENDEWELTTDPKYEGSSVTLNSGEEIWVSPLSYEDGPSISFTRSSGEGCYGFLKYDGDVLNETVNFWLGADGQLDGNYTLSIYNFGSDDYAEVIDWSDDYSEENIQNHLGDPMCILRYNETTNEWDIEEDNT